MARSNLWLDHALQQVGTASLHRLVQLHAAIRDREPEGRENEAVEQPGPRRFPGRLTRRVRSEVRRAESGESGAHLMNPARPSRQDRGNEHFAPPNHAGGGESRVESGREPLQVDRGGRQVGLDLHVSEAAPHGAAQPVLRLRFSVEALRPPEMAPVQLPVLFAPSKRPPTAAQQRRIVVADDRRPAPALLGQAVALERAARAVLRLGVEEPTVLPGLARTQHLAPRAFHDVVLRVVAEPAKRHAALGRLPLRRDQRIDPPPLQAAADLGEGAARVGGRRHRYRI